MKRVVITAPAQADIQAIGDYIAKDNRTRASTFTDQLRARCAELAEMPEAYPLADRYERSGIRRRVFRNYLIFFRIRSERIEIVRVLHGARDPASLL